MIERTLLLLKPDCVQRSLIGEVISRFEKTGLKIVGMKMVWCDEDFATKHYFDMKERYGEKIYRLNADFLKEGPIVAMVLEGAGAIKVVRKIVGSTYPDEALPGTIRGDYSHISREHANENNKKVANLIHASSSKEDATREINLWFTPIELHSYKTVHDMHVI